MTATVAPCSRRYRRRSSSSPAADSGSKLAKGSSRIIPRGSKSRRQQRAAFCFSPPDRVESFLASSSSTPYSRANFSTRASISSGLTERFSRQKNSSLRRVSIQNCRSGF